MGIKGKNIVVRQVSTEKPANNETCCGTTTVYEDDYYIPYYYPSMNTIMWFGSIIFWIFIACVIVQGALIGLIAFFAPRRKSYRCPKCKRTFPMPGQMPDYCEFCGADLKENLRPH